MKQNNKFEIVISKIPSWVSVSLLIFTLSFFGYLIWNNNNLSNRILALENQQIHNKPFQITKFEKDSILLELNKYQQKEDYFTTALEVQAGHYEHITSWGITISAFLLGIAGVIGFSWFWSKYDETKERFNDLEHIIETNLTKSKEKIDIEVKNLNKRFLTLEVKSNQALGNSLSIIAEIMEREKEYFDAYQFFISAAYVNSQFKKTAIVVPANLASADDCLNNLNTDIGFDTEETNDVKKKLEDLTKSENEDIKKRAKIILQNHNKKFKL